MGLCPPLQTWLGGRQRAQRPIKFLHHHPDKEGQDWPGGFEPLRRPDLQIAFAWLNTSPAQKPGAESALDVV